MSIHVNLSEEAETILRKQKRNSSILSILISGLIVTLIFFVLGFFALKSIPHHIPEFDVTYARFSEPLQLPKPPKPSSTRSNPTAPANRVPNVIVSNSALLISVPTINVDLTTPSMDMSNDGFFDGDIGLIGPIGAGRTFDKINPTLSKRCSQGDRLSRLKDMGGKVETEATVERGLEWLKATQNTDGSWSNKYLSAMTGFGVLVYLGRCETPDSTKYGESCLRAISYLVDLGMKNDGKLSTNTSDKHWPYEHAIATYALCEALTFCRQLKTPIPNLEEITHKSVNIIIENQHEKSGGWDYGYDTTGNRGGDLSIAAWHIQALKAASHTGLDIKRLKTTQSKAMEYVESLQGENGGFGYTGKPGDQGYAKLTGAGVLCLQMSNRKRDSSIRKGIKHIAEFSKFDYNGKDSNLYAHYYESQAMVARGGSEWRKYNEMLGDQLINAQNSDGSWKIPGSQADYADPHYRTCLNILMLEVYYRFLPGTSSL